MNRSRSPQRKAMTQRFNVATNVLHTDMFIGEAAQLKPRDARPSDAVLFRGVWDTGASSTVISENVVNTLNLSSLDKVETKTANGIRVANVYLINVYLKAGVTFLGLRVTDGTLADLDFLIGMDIIGSGDFAVTRSDSKTCVSFQIPHGDGPIDFVKLNKRRR